MRMVEIEWHEKPRGFWLGTRFDGKDWIQLCGEERLCLAGTSLHKDRAVAVTRRMCFVSTVDVGWIFLLFFSGIGVDHGGGSI